MTNQRFGVLEEAQLAVEKGGMTPYHVVYFAHELTERSPSNSVERLTNALADAQVGLNLHQINAALFAVRNS